MGSPGPLPDAWMLAGLLVGYILGNRGFAQWVLTSWFPLLPAEAGLIVFSSVLIVRMARKQVPGIRRDSLNLAVLAWIIAGTVRIVFDYRNYGFDALRDYATIYYAAFFFIAQALVRHDASARVLRRALLAACLALPLSYLIYSRLPDTFLTRLSFRGVPLLFYKDDLVAAYLFAGFFLFQTVRSWTPALRGMAAASGYAVVFMIDSSRAALVGLAVTCGWWALARRWEPWRLQAILIPAGISVLAFLAVVRATDVRQSRLFAMYEHIVSIADVTGTRTYESEDRAFVGDNNRFRLIWWRSVADEAWAANPALGLGFGHDLAARFIQNYNIAMQGDFSARSPHSIAFTAFGRMGLVGLAAFLFLTAAMVRRTWLLVSVVRYDDAALPVLGWWSVSWVLFTSACFGVVLEGPMGAVIFWTALGAASHGTAALVVKADGKPAEPAMEHKGGRI
jgi:hypothetical protein